MKLQTGLVSLGLVIAVAGIVLLLANISPSRSPEAAPTAGDSAAFVPVPTFTPTPAQPDQDPPQAESSTPLSQGATSTEARLLPTPAQGLPSSAAADAPTGPAPAEEIPTESTPSEPAFTPPPVQEEPTSTPPPPSPQLQVEGAALNIRSGPGTLYPTIGLAESGASFPISGRNEAGDWWQICCVDGQPGWLYAPLVTAQQTEGVPIAAYDPPPSAVSDAAKPAPPTAQTDAPPAQEPPPRPRRQRPQPSPRILKAPRATLIPMRSSTLSTSGYWARGRTTGALTARAGSNWSSSLC